MHLALLRRFYIARGYQTVWDTRPAAAKRLRDAVLQADNHGLDLGLFHGSLLGERGQSLSSVDRYLILSDAFLSYADALSRGVMPIEQRLDDEDLTPEPVDVVAVLDAAIADPDPAKMIEALAPSSEETLVAQVRLLHGQALFKELLEPSRRLVAQYRDLHVLGIGRAAQADQAEDLPDDHEGQRAHDHALIIVNE